MNTWSYMITHDHTWSYMIIHDHTWSYMCMLYNLYTAITLLFTVYCVVVSCRRRLTLRPLQATSRDAEGPLGWFLWDSQASSCANLWKCQQESIHPSGCKQFRSCRCMNHETWVIHPMMMRGCRRWNFGFETVLLRERNRRIQIGEGPHALPWLYHKTLQRRRNRCGGMSGPILGTCIAGSPSKRSLLQWLKHLSPSTLY